MKTIFSAQADFRANDRDKNGVHDYWRRDIAGLYTLLPEEERRRSPEHPEPIQLIELSVAGADDGAGIEVEAYTTRSTKAGYWFRALRFEDEIELDPDRFAACAFPDNRSVGKWTYILSHENTLYRKDLGPNRGMRVYPSDPEASGWEKRD